MHERSEKCRSAARNAGTQREMPARSEKMRGMLRKRGSAAVDTPRWKLADRSCWSKQARKSRRAPRARVRSRIPRGRTTSRERGSDLPARTWRCYESKLREGRNKRAVTAFSATNQGANHRETKQVTASR